MDTNGQDLNGLHLGNLEKSRPDVFQFMANRMDNRFSNLFARGDVNNDYTKMPFYGLNTS